MSFREDLNLALAVGTGATLVKFVAGVTNKDSHYWRWVERSWSGTRPAAGPDLQLAVRERWPALPVDKARARLAIERLLHKLDDANFLAEFDTGRPDAEWDWDDWSRLMRGLREGVSARWDRIAASLPSDEAPLAPVDYVWLRGPVTGGYARSFADLRRRYTIPERSFAGIFNAERWRQLQALGREFGETGEGVFPWTAVQIASALRAPYRETWWQEVRWILREVARGLAALGRDALDTGTLMWDAAKLGAYVAGGLLVVSGGWRLLQQRRAQRSLPSR